MTRAHSNLFYQSGSRRPLLDHASGVYLWDKSGKRYLDGSSGAMVSNIGHSNQNVLEAMRQQMELSTFGYRLHFENEPAEALASAISDKMPSGLDRVFFVSGGSEAVESCIKLARQYALATGEGERWKVISRFPSYHGSTLGALSLTGMSLMSAPFAPMMREMQKIADPTCYLDRDQLTEEERGLKYARLLREEILRQGPETVLAFIMEPVGGASTGALVAPDSYYQEIRRICDEFGVLLISDEVERNGPDGRVSPSTLEGPSRYRRAVERVWCWICSARRLGRGSRDRRQSTRIGWLCSWIHLSPQSAGMRRTGGHEGN